MANIYIYVIEDENKLVAQALAEDGSCLLQHFITNRIYARHEMGVTGRKRHGLYQKHDPEYRLVDLTACSPEELYQHPDFLDALNRNVLEANVANIPDVPVTEE